MSERMGLFLMSSVFLVDVRRPSKDIDKIISATTNVDMMLCDRGIVSATDLLTEL